MPRLAGLFVEIVGNALQAILESRHSEIHQKAQRQIHQTQIGENLLAMHGGISLDGLEFDQKLVFDQDIRLESVVYRYAPVADGHCHLATHEQTALRQFLSEKDLINRFEQTRPDLLVQPEAAIDGDPGKAIEFDQVQPLGVLA